MRTVAPTSPSPDVSARGPDTAPPRENAQDLKAADATAPAGTREAARGPVAPAARAEMGFVDTMDRPGAGAGTSGGTETDRSRTAVPGSTVATPETRSPMVNDESRQFGSTWRRAEMAYLNATRSPEGREGMAMALTGKETAALDATNTQAFDALNTSIRDGKMGGLSVAPGRNVPPMSANAASGTLPQGERGSFTGSGFEDGNILVSSEQSRSNMALGMREQLGTAVAAEASRLGMDVAPGNVGERMSRNLNGPSVTPATAPDLYDASASSGSASEVALDADAIPAPASGRDALRDSFRASGVDVDGLDAKGQATIDRFGGTIDRLKTEPLATAADVARIAGGDVPVERVEGLAADDGTRLDGALTSDGRVLIDADLEKSPDALRSTAIEEIAEAAFRSVVAGAAGGAPLAAANAQGRSKGDFGAEVEARATGSLPESSLATLRGASSSDGVTIDGMPAEARNPLDKLRNLGGSLRRIANEALPPNAPSIANTIRKKHVRFTSQANQFLVELQRLTFDDLKGKATGNLFSAAQIGLGGIEKYANNLENVARNRKNIDRFTWDTLNGVRSSLLNVAGKNADSNAARLNPVKSANSGLARFLINLAPGNESLKKRVRESGNNVTVSANGIAGVLNRTPRPSGVGGGGGAPGTPAPAGSSRPGSGSRVCAAAACASAGGAGTAGAATACAGAVGIGTAGAATACAGAGGVASACAAAAGVANVGSVRACAAAGCAGNANAGATTAAAVCAGNATAGASACAGAACGGNAAAGLGACAGNSCAGKLGGPIGACAGAACAGAACGARATAGNACLGNLCGGNFVAGPDIGLCIINIIPAFPLF